MNIPSRWPTMQWHMLHEDEEVQLPRVVSLSYNKNKVDRQIY